RRAGGARAEMIFTLATRIERMGRRWRRQPTATAPNTDSTGWLRTRSSHFSRHSMVFSLPEWSMERMPSSTDGGALGSVVMAYQNLRRLQIRLREPEMEWSTSLVGMSWMKSEALLARAEAAS